MTNVMLSLPVWLIAALMMLLPATHVAAQTNTLHGNAAEAQVVSEMRERMKSALANGDVAACKREGDNLARYGKAEQGEVLIARDVASNQRRLDAIKIIYKSYYDLRTLYNKKSVKQAFKLINQLQDKLLDDARDDALVVFIPAHAVSGKIAVEFFKAAKDVYENNTDAGELKDTAKALKDLDLLVKKYDEKMKQLTPEIRNLEQTRTFLIGCHAAFIEAEHATTAATNRGTSLFDGVWHTTRQHQGCCSYSASEDLAFSTDSSGMTSSTTSGFLGSARGRVTGTSLTLDYGIANNAASGHATLTLGAGGKSFSGSFSDKNGHRGTVRGNR